MSTKIQSISHAALDWIQKSTNARILHVFDPVCNLINEEGEILSLAGPFVGNGPFSAVSDKGLFRSWINDRSTVDFSGNGLSIDGQIVSTENAKLWSPRPNWESVRSKPEILIALSDHIEDLLKEHAPPESFAEFVLSIPSTFSINDQVLQKADSAISKLMPALISADFTIIREASHELGGLGAGLTPAGDDFLVGIMHGLWSIYPDPESLAKSLIIAESAIPRTNSLSAAWLKAAANGEAGEPWHQLIKAVVAQSKEETEAAVMRILPTGHSSGADALGGFSALIRGFLKDR